LKKNILACTLIILFCLFVVSCKKGGRWSREWEERYEESQPSDVIMDILKIEPGMVVGEVGAGNGRFSVRLAQRIGSKGLVFANDIDKKAIRFMNKRIKRENIKNMRVIEGKVTDPQFPEKQLDLVCVINTYDHLSHPVELMKNIHPSLKPDGRLAILVLDPGKLENSSGHAVSKETVIRQAESAGFELIQMHTSFQYDNIYIFHQKS
jgi:ubiquinone/menaquinone biosynthesis C-methylase UbiE